MSKGQTRVLVLLGVLLALEMVLQPTIKTFFGQVAYTINSNLTGAGSSQSIAQQVQQKPDSKGNCPPGYVMTNGTCYNVKGV